MAEKASHKQLLLAWCLLVLLTLASIFSGRAASGTAVSLGPVLFGLLMAVTVFKALQILDVYLGLRESSPAWRHGFAVSVWLICGIVWGIYVLDQWI